MMTVSEADQILREKIKPFNPITCPIGDAQGRALHEDVVADRDQPPFHRVTMDGIAIDFAAWEAGQRQFKIQGTQAAGQPPLALARSEDGCIEIMTGAMLPDGCNCVIPYEDVTIDGDTAIISADTPGQAVQRMQNIHERGSDCQKGQVLIKKGTTLHSPQISIAASVGYAQLQVNDKPRIAIITTGDELVDVGDPVEPYQIRRSNGYAIQSVLKLRDEFETSLHHVADDRDHLTTLLTQALADHDAIILSGGVSRGKFDYVPETLEKVGVTEHFHRVKQRPGKPLWFGTHESGKPVFGLPGNPVSSLVCFRRYILPQLYRAMGFPPPVKEIVILRNRFDFDPPLTLFLPVKVIISIDGNRMATPLPTNTSGDFITLAESDGFIELPAPIKYFPAGYKTPIYRWA